jgi:hypothetical protein
LIRLPSTLWVKSAPRYSAGKVVTKVNQGAGMRVPAARQVRAAGAEAGVRPFDAAIIVEVIGDRFDFAVGVWIEVLARLALVVATLDHVVEVGNHASGDKRVADVVEVEPPLIAHALGEDLKDLFGRMVAPDTGVEGRAVLVAGPGFADVGMGEDSLVAVEPAIGSPDEAVQGFVRVLRSPAIEHRLRRAIGRIVAILVRNEKQVGRTAHPDAAMTDGDAAGEVQLVVENLARVVPAVAIGVFEDEDPIPTVGVTSAGRHSSPPPTAKAGPVHRS